MMLVGEHMLSTQDAAALLGITHRAVLKAIQRKKMVASKFGRDWVITPEAVEAYRVTYLRKPK